MCVSFGDIDVLDDIPSHRISPISAIYVFQQEVFAVAGRHIKI